MITIKPHAITGELHVVSSKSLSHRYVIAAALAHGKSRIKNILNSDDLTATKEALVSLGAQIHDNEIIGGPITAYHTMINAKESGSTLRFFIPISMVQKEAVTFIGEGRLAHRPLNVFETMFRPFGYLFERPDDAWLPLKVKGPLQSGIYQMHGNVSSQFLTGLLYALPLIKGTSTIELLSPLESSGYVDLTLLVLKQFGIQIDYHRDRYVIKGNQLYQPQNILIEGDYSQAAFWIVAATIGAPLLLKDLNEHSLQGDKTILEFVKLMGGVFEFNQNGLYITPSRTHGVTIDLSQTPDLGPILMVLASLSKGKTHIINAKRLRIKESDRLQAMYEELSKLGVKMDIYEDAVTIYGQDSFKGNVSLKTHGDHRIAMALAVASIRAKGPIILDDETVVSKSYPTFFEEFKRLGGIFNE